MMRESRVLLRSSCRSEIRCGFSVGFGFRYAGWEKRKREERQTREKGEVSGGRGPLEKMKKVKLPKLMVGVALVFGVFVRVALMVKRERERGSRGGGYGLGRRKNES
ncbi:hypothetical protein HAX54_048309 [Datura stramonium]|uniref:Transmembrane protein n=1 Tax=Datura stramonium TaxID=4076 RepID=A0ABS8WNV6_DATST|nr:hypothetical protein [Datura stramonium]